MSTRLEGHKKYLVEEFAEDYLENRLSRRDLVTRVLLLTGSVTATAGVLTSLGCGPGSNTSQTTAPSTATAQPAVATAVASPTVLPPGVTVSPNDPAIQVQDVKFSGQAGDVLGYLSRPKANGTYPAILVIHENRGVSEHIKDITRRYAKENFVALAVDLLSRAGGTDKLGANEMSAAYATLTVPQMVADAQSAINYLKTQPFVKAGALGLTGFCFGGGVVWEIAIASPDVKAAVPYYGSVRDLNELAKTQAAVFAVYAEDDARITGQIPEVEQRLKAAGKTIQTKVYPGTRHAFFNDTGERYVADAAKVAWPDTVTWFRRYLT